MRLIDSEKLIEYCNNQKVKTIDANDIARFPTVDATPVKHGKWTKKRTQKHDGEWYCTACDYEPIVMTDDMKYCPGCGAKMDLEGLDDRCDQQSNAEK